MIKAILYKEKAASIPDIKKIIKIFNRKIKTKEKIEVNIILVDTLTIKKINTVYRKKKKATDVLSFRYDKQRGEIFICATSAQEIKRLIIHGLLHIIGYDHEISLHESKKMFNKQEEILKLC